MASHSSSLGRGTDETFGGDEYLYSYGLIQLWCGYGLYSYGTDETFGGDGYLYSYGLIQLWSM